MEHDAGLYERQTAGIAALLSLANEVATVRRTGELRKLVEEGERRQGRLRALWTRLREDPMTWNSLQLVVNTGLLAGFGFAFWIITTHLFSVPDVGDASALFSATGLIGSFALFGLNNGMGKYLPESENPDGLIGSGITVVGVFGVVGAFIYVLLLPVIAPDLSFVTKSPMLAIGFALITAAECVNTLTSAVFVAQRNAKYSTIVNGIIGGGGKVVLAFVLAGAGTYGLFVASASGLVLAAIASLLLIYTTMHTRLDLRQPIKTLKPLFGFAGANYVGNVLNMIPGLAVPDILLDRLGKDSAAYFFVVFQIVQIVYAAALALEQTFLSEGSRSDADMRGLRRRSVRMLVMFCVPAALGIIGVGHWLLLAFGGAYARNGFPSLVILCLAAGPIAANYWYLTVLRIAGKLRAIVVVNAIYAATTCIAAWIGAAYGLTGVSAGWLVGALIAALASVVAARTGEPQYEAEPQDEAPPEVVDRPRRLQPPVNPFEPRHDRRPQPVRPVRPPAYPIAPSYDRVDPRPADRGYPGAVNSGGYRVNGNGERTDRANRPVNGFEPGYDRPDPRRTSGGYGPHANGGTPRRTPPPNNPNGGAYDHTAPGRNHGGYAEGPVNRNGQGYDGSVDPGLVNGEHPGRGNGERPRPMRRPVNPDERGDDHGSFYGKTSVWD